MSTLQICGRWPYSVCLLHNILSHRHCSSPLRAVWLKLSLLQSFLLLKAQCWVYSLFLHFAFWACRLRFFVFWTTYINFDDYFDHHFTNCFSIHSHVVLYCMCQHTLCSHSMLLCWETVIVLLGSSLYMRLKFSLILKVPLIALLLRSEMKFICIWILWSLLWSLLHKSLIMLHINGLNVPAVILVSTVYIWCWEAVIFVSAGYVFTFNSLPCSEFLVSEGVTLIGCSQNVFTLLFISLSKNLLWQK